MIAIGKAAYIVLNGTASHDLLDEDNSKLLVLLNLKMEHQTLLHIILTIALYT